MPASDALKFQADTLTELVAGVQPDQMEGPTPCSDWDVRGLLNHFVGGATMFAAAFSGESVDMADASGDMVGDDPLGSWNTAVGAFMNAVDQPGALEREIPLPFGAMPGAMVLELLKFDLTVHAWDLAQATGQSYDPPADVVAHADTVGRQMVNDDFRAAGAFAAEVSMPSDATPLDRLIAFTGRAPMEPTGS